MKLRCKVQPPDICTLATPEPASTQIIVNASSTRRCAFMCAATIDPISGDSVVSHLHLIYARNGEWYIVDFASKVLVQQGLYSGDDPKP